MKKILSSKYWWIALLFALVLINWVASKIHYRLDLTAEKRYTISAPTKKLLKNLQEPVNITVFLEGDMPAGFKKLANSTRELLQEFKEAGKTKFTFNFKKAGEGLADSTKMFFLDSLARLGIKPYTINAQVKEGEGTEERQVVPGALVTYGGRVLAVDLLAGQNSSLDETSINRVEATLEYKFANTIRKISIDTIPLIAYMIGNGQSLSYNVYDFIENNLKRNYAFRILNIDSFPAIPPVFSAIIIAKPTKKFTDEQKLKLDQYIMRGGKVLWMIDNLYAEMDSLQRSQNEFIAFDRGLNIEDLLFKYGARINSDLVQDLNCDQFPLAVGNVGDKPQLQMLDWPYFPLVSNYSNHPVSKNLDYVVTQFPNSIDTVKAAGIKKTILLSTSPRSRILSTPAKVSLNSIQTKEDVKTFNKPNIPVALLLEGRFTSLYTNRISGAVKDSLSAIQFPFVQQNMADNKMIVISDGDIAMNAVTQNEGPLQMGRNQFTKYQYANGEFIMNSIEYLVDNSGILETRGKDFTLRLLDKQKLEDNKTTWQWVNIALPLLLVIVLGGIYQYIRKRKYA